MSHGQTESRKSGFLPCIASSKPVVKHGKLVGGGTTLGSEMLVPWWGSPQAAEESFPGGSPAGHLMRSQVELWLTC